MIFFTYDEISLMSIYDTGTKEGLIEELTKVQQHLGSDDVELIALTNSALKKLKKMPAGAYEALDLFPDFNELIENTL